MQGAKFSSFDCYYGQSGENSCSFDKLGLQKQENDKLCCLSHDFMSFCAKQLVQFFVQVETQNVIEKISPPPLRNNEVLVNKRLFYLYLYLTSSYFIKQFYCILFSHSAACSAQVSKRNKNLFLSVCFGYWQKFYTLAVR